jgi:Mg-chelatase subunit ChlD
MTTRAVKVKLVALGLFLATAATVALVPERPDTTAVATSPVKPPAPVRPAGLTNERPKVEVVFVLDTTGSMGGLIQAAKEKIWSIATTMSRAQPAPEIRIGLVAYRDRGDSYVTRVVDLSSDLDSMYATLMDFRAEGGGDGPESVNQALHDAVHGVSWSQDPQAYKVDFLVGDAPPHMDYQDDVKYPATLAAARRRGIVVNAIQCGDLYETAGQWRDIAQLAGGEYFRVDQTGSAVAIATPFDGRLAELSAALDTTRMYYGSKADREAQELKVAATARLAAESSVESRARRAEFNASASGHANLVGSNELVDDVASGRVKLADIAPAELPEALRPLAPAAQQAAVDEMAAKRSALLSEVDALSKERADYLRQKVEESGGAADSLDVKLYEAVREQAKDKGLHYEADAPAY